MILQVAFTRVDAENRSVVWHALNLPGADGDLLLLLFNSSLNLAWKFGLLATWSPGEQHSNLASTMSQLCGSSESYFLTCPQTCASLSLCRFRSWRHRPSGCCGPWAWIILASSSSLHPTCHSVSSCFGAAFTAFPGFSGVQPSQHCLHGLSHCMSSTSSQVP